MIHAIRTTAVSRPTPSPPPHDGLSRHTSQPAIPSRTSPADAEPTSNPVAAAASGIGSGRERSFAPFAGRSSMGAVCRTPSWIGVAPDQ